MSHRRRDSSGSCYFVFVFALVLSDFQFGFLVFNHGEEYKLVKLVSDGGGVTRSGLILSSTKTIVAVLLPPGSDPFSVPNRRSSPPHHTIPPSLISHHRDSPSWKLRRCHNLLATSIFLTAGEQEIESSRSQSCSHSTAEFATGYPLVLTPGPSPQIWIKILVNSFHGRRLATVSQLCQTQLLFWMLGLMWTRPINEKNWNWVGLIRVRALKPNMLFKCLVCPTFLSSIWQVQVSIVITWGHLKVSFVWLRRYNPSSGRGLRLRFVSTSEKRSFSSWSNSDTGGTPSILSRVMAVLKSKLTNPFDYLIKHNALVGRGLLPKLVLTWIQGSLDYYTSRVFLLTLSNHSIKRRIQISSLWERSTSFSFYKERTLSLSSNMERIIPPPFSTMEIIFKSSKTKVLKTLRAICVVRSPLLAEELDIDFKSINSETFWQKFPVFIYDDYRYSILYLLCPLVYVSSVTLLGKEPSLVTLV